MPSSLPLELGLSLLVEGADAFEAILGHDGRIIGLDREDHRGVEVGLGAVRDGLLRLTDGDRAVLRDRRGDLGGLGARLAGRDQMIDEDRKSTRLNSSHVKISYAVFCLKKKKKK